MLHVCIFYRWHNYWLLLTDKRTVVQGFSTRLSNIYKYLGYCFPLHGHNLLSGHPLALSKWEASVRSPHAKSQANDLWPFHLQILQEQTVMSLADSWTLQDRIRGCVPLGMLTLMGNRLNFSSLKSHTSSWNIWDWKPWARLMSFTLSHEED